MSPMTQIFSTEEGIQIDESDEQLWVIGLIRSGFLITHFLSRNDRYLQIFFYQENV
jgi:hypothetical protein